VKCPPRASGDSGAVLSPVIPRNLLALSMFEGENSMRLPRNQEAARQRQTLEHLIQLLQRSIIARELAIFCGAGISFTSGIPVVSQFLPAVFQTLGLATAEWEQVLQKEMPFEARMEVLVHNSVPHRLYDVFRIGEPNANHVLLAKLARAHLVTTLCTTNFDSLIETALDREGLVRNRDYRVYSTIAELDRFATDSIPSDLLKSTALRTTQHKLPSPSVRSPPANSSPAEWRLCATFSLPAPTAMCLS